MWSQCLLSTSFVERVGAEVVECACVIGVPDVKVTTNYVYLSQNFLCCSTSPPQVQNS